MWIHKKGRDYIVYKDKLGGEEFEILRGLFSRSLPDWLDLKDGEYKEIESTENYTYEDIKRRNIFLCSLHNENWKELYLDWQKYLLEIK